MLVDLMTCLHSLNDIYIHAKRVMGTTSAGHRSLLTVLTLANPQLGLLQATDKLAIIATLLRVTDIYLFIERPDIKSLNLVELDFLRNLQ